MKLKLQNGLNRILFFSVFMMLCNSLYSQMSFEEYKATYKPNYKTITPDMKLVKTINESKPAVGAAAIEILLENIEKNSSDQDSKLKIVAILTSCKRDVVANILKNLSTENAIKALNTIKDEWVREVMWFVDVNTYHNLASSLDAIKNFKINDGAFGQKSSKWMLSYAGIGYDRSIGGYSAFNKYIEAYNSQTNKVDGGNNPITLTEPLNKMATTSGIDVFGAFYKTGKRIFEIQFQSRKAVSKGGGSNWSSSYSFGSNALNFLILKPSKHYYRPVITYSGWGFHGAMANVKSEITAQDVTGLKQGRLGGGSSVGVSYNLGMYINPSKKFPVMIGLRAYAQFNVLLYDVSFLESGNPQGAPQELKSMNNLYGLQFQAIYKFPTQTPKHVYPTFSDEIIAKMDKHINTTYSEISPTISPDGKTLYFIRSDHPLNNAGAYSSQDIWVADISNGIENASARHLEAPFNTRTYNSIAGVSPDENTMLIKGYFKKGVYEKKGYSFIYRTVDGWSQPEGIDIKDYENMAKGTYVAAYWTQDGKHLILGFSESSSDDNENLYVSHLQKDGSWSRPISLGPTINTKGNDIHSPFMASDGKTLYYSSNREGGLGSNDIWMSKRLDDSWTKWSEPENLGSEVNTPKWDAYYSIDASGRYAYMASSENSVGLTDIVRIELKQEVQPDPVILIRGKVLNEKTNEPIGATIVYNGIEDGVNYGIARTNPATGEYKIVLPYGKNYDITASAPNFIGVSENLDLRQVGEYREIEKNLFLVPIEVGATVRLNNIFFEFGSANLKEESYSELNRVVEFMQQNPTVKIELSGHTDNVGSDAANNKLSQDRVNSVKSYLVSKGISESRMTAKGYGKTKPVATNDTEEGRQQNRRVEFSILEK
ncbi:MAG: OmpA family protein [Bacteroidetes bacterium]|nr:OmpA family protein [Bacteroidota bacterium]